MKLNPHSGQVSLLHVVVVLLSLMLTFGAWHYSRTQTEIKVEQRFDLSRDRVVGLIRDRMKKYEDALWAGVSTVNSHGGDMTLDQWRAFAKLMRIQEKYPGINGIGIIHHVPEQSLADYMRQRLVERPGYRVHPAHDQRPYLPISFIEPEGPNAAAVGLDVAHEVNRRTAALAARDTGHARITGPIVLVQDAGSTPGFLFYAPFYRGGEPRTLAERQDRFAGAVYAPFVVRRLMDGLLAKELRAISLSISDAGETIYDEHLAREQLHDPDPMFTEQLQLEVYGRTWVLDIRSNLAFRSDNTYAQPTIILIAGLVIEALVIALLVLMSRANRRAVTYAQEVTAELKLEQERLIRTNDELEQFAYITSHDLKTPIRGIGGLIEMLSDDLEPYLQSKDANPEVSATIALIHDRIQRMHDLTTGIIEFSRIGEGGQSTGPLVLRDVITSLTSDLELQPEQLQLDSPVDSVQVDAINLRRVLENLIGNAVKYHEGAAPLRVKVTVRDGPDYLDFSVSDNGPGIHPDYQHKIFEMFQTLRTGNSAESTGIGLAIVKKAIEMHGGSIRLVSAPGQGATFQFRWPKNPAMSAAFECGLAA